MKRKITFLLFLILSIAISYNSIAQNHFVHNSGKRQKTVLKNPNADRSNSSREILFYEDFSNGIGDWTTSGEGADNWSVEDYNAAGGVAPEAEFVYSPLFEGRSRLISPVINTTGFSSLNISFLHFIDSYVGGFWVSVETTSDGGDTWNQVWELFWDSENNYGAFESLGITTTDVGSDNFQFCFKFEDNSDFIDGWAIDDITLGDPISNDVGPTSIGGLENFVYGGDPLTISTDVFNFGSETVTFDVVLEITDGSDVVFTSTKTVTDLAFGNSTNVEFETWTSTVGLYTATVTSQLSGDENSANDMVDKDFAIFDPESYCIPLADCSYGDGFDDFTFAGIENLGSGCSDNGYGVFSDMQASVEIGSTYTATFTSGYDNQNVTIWVDFNEDFEFSPLERILTDFNLANGGETYSVDILIPGYASPGIKRMRAGANYSDLSSPDPCASFEYGEWEDYSIEITGTATNYDAGISSIDMQTIVLPGDVIPKVTVSNFGTETVSFPVTCTVEGTSYTSTLNVVDLGYLESIQLEFDAWNTEAGVYILNFQTSLDGDENPDNDAMSTTVSVTDVIPSKMVVGEEGTGTWCGWCVRGIVFMDYMAETYPDTWIGIAVHNGDPMVVSEYDSELGPRIGNAYPGALIDRAIYDDPSNFEADYQTQISKIPPASIFIENSHFNSSTNELVFTLTSEFVASVSNYRFNAVLIENNVTGTGSGYNQANYYSGGGQGPMGGYEDLPNPVPAADMVYQHVARALLGHWEGVEGSLPETINAGETHSWDFTTVVSPNWNMYEVEIIGMLINQNTGEIENATRDGVLTGISNPNAETQVLVYPNPSTDRVNIKSAEDMHTLTVYNQLGSLIYNENCNAQSIQLDVSQYNSGLYLLRIETKNGTVVKQMIVK